MEDNHDIQHKDKSRKLRGVTLIAIGVAVALVVMKAVAWLLTGSVALLGSLIDSVLDLMVSTVNFFVVQHALTPADKEHRFGHGKAEALAAMAQGLIISISGLFLGYESVQHFLAPAQMRGVDVGIGVMMVSIVLTLGLVRVQRKVAQETGSLAVAADSAHYKSDLVMNMGVIAAIVLSSYGGFIYADPALGLFVTLILFNSARKILGEAANQLMDHELPDETRAIIKKLIMSHPKTRGLHDLRTRASGTQKFIQCHVELDGKLTLVQAHDISDEIEEIVMATFPEAEVIIHQDPVGHEDVTKLEKS